MVGDPGDQSTQIESQPLAASLELTEHVTPQEVEAAHLAPFYPGPLRSLVFRAIALSCIAIALATPNAHSHTRLGQT